MLQLTTKSTSARRGGGSSKVIPTVVLSIATGDLTSSTIFTKISEFQKNDDVYFHEFLTHTVVLQVARSTTVHLATAASTLRDSGRMLGVNWDPVTIYPVQSSRLKKIPDGPYFIHGHGIFEAWKVYSDDCDAFQTTVVPNRSGPYE